MKHIVKHAFSAYAVALYVVSVVLLLLGYTTQLQPTTLGDVFRALGIGIFITTLVSSFLNYFLHIDINRHFRIVGGTTIAGIREVYRERIDALAQINNEVPKAHRQIRLLSVAGTDFFHEQCPIIAELDRMRGDDSNILVRVLLMDPRSPHAVVRALIEDGVPLKQIFGGDCQAIDYRATALCTNILTSLAQLEQLLKDQSKQNFKLEVRLYDTAPILLLAHVNGRVFVEQYHCGITEEERNTKLKRCLGKRVPVLEYEGGCAVSRLWVSHFDMLWEMSISRVVKPGVQRELSRLIRDDKTWLKLFEAYKELSQLHLSTGAFRIVEVKDGVCIPN